MAITKQRVEEIISRIEMYGHGAGYTADEVYDLAVLALNLSNIANLKRYELDMDGCDSFGQDCGADMTEDSDGNYVLFDDVVKLFEFDTTTQKLEGPAKEQPVSVTVEKIDVLSFVITGAERLDPVRVMIENYEPGKGRITITCYGKAWTAAWFAMGGDDVQTFIKRVSNEYLIGYFDPQLRSTVDDDNDANLLFVKSEIIKLRREREIDAVLAREMWYEAENADDVKESCCCFGVGNKLLNLFGDDPWYADWPTAPNPKYQYLERVLNAVRDGIKQIEKVEP